MRVETRAYYLTKWHRKHSHAKILLSTNKAQWGRKKQFSVHPPALGRVERRLREPRLTCLGLPSALSLSTHLVLQACSALLAGPMAEKTPEPDKSPPVTTANYKEASKNEFLKRPWVQKSKKRYTEKLK